jgi:hypothetical protein
MSKFDTAYLLALFVTSVPLLSSFVGSRGKKQKHERCLLRVLGRIVFWENDIRFLIENVFHIDHSIFIAIRNPRMVFLCSVIQRHKLNLK